MPAKTERYRFVPWEIKDVNGITRKLPGGYANVTRGGGMKHNVIKLEGIKVFIERCRKADKVVLS